jgi:hypothetical protein
MAICAEADAVINIIHLRRVFSDRDDVMRVNFIITIAEFTQPSGALLYEPRPSALMRTISAKSGHASAPLRIALALE